MIIHLLLIILAFCPASLTLEPGLDPIENMKAISITCDSEEQVKLVSRFYNEKGFDYLVTPTQYHNDYEVFVTADKFPSFKKFLTNHNITYQVDIQDVSEVIAHDFQHLRCTRRRNKRNEIINFEDITSCPQYDTIQAFLNDIAVKYPNIVELISIGKSFEGRDLTAVKISSGKTKKERAMLIDAGIHAREWLAPITAVYAVAELVEKEENHHIFDNLDIYIICLLNPDGYEYTFQDPTTRLWRKTRSVHESSECRGVDANRNFDFHWTSNGKLADPCSAVYSGPKPFSEPETLALKNFVMERPEIKTYITLHSYGNMILFPNGHTSILHDDFTLLRCVAKKASKAIHSVYKTNYVTGPISHILNNSPFSLGGNSADWALGKANMKLAFAIELPSKQYKFNVPHHAIQLVGEETFEAFKVFAEHAQTLECNDFW